jgi:hypothetical protein
MFKSTDPVVEIEWLSANFSVKKLGFMCGLLSFISCINLFDTKLVLAPVSIRTIVSVFSTRHVIRKLGFSDSYQLFEYIVIYTQIEITS